MDPEEIAARTLEAVAMFDEATLCDDGELGNALIRAAVNAATYLADILEPDSWAVPEDATVGHDDNNP